jgi:hypothetical protein
VRREKKKKRNKRKEMGEMVCYQTANQAGKPLKKGEKKKKKSGVLEL